MYNMKLYILREIKCCVLCRHISAPTKIYHCLYHSDQESHEGQLEYVGIFNQLTYGYQFVAMCIRVIILHSVNSPQYVFRIFHNIFFFLSGRLLCCNFNVITLFKPCPLSSHKHFSN